MDSRDRYSALALVLALAGAAPGAAQPPVPAADYLLAVEGLRLDFSIDDLLANDQHSGSVVVEWVAPPRHGLLTCAGGDCAYQPDLRFVGEDALSYRLRDQGAASEEAPVRIRVSPLVTPLAGDWRGDGSLGLAFYRAAEQAFDFADLIVDLDDEKASFSLLVGQSPLPEGERGWLPVAGDWDGDGRQDLGLFDPAKRTFHLFLQGPASGWPPGWQPWETLSFPLAGQGGLPFAGDWDGGPADEVGLLLTNDARVALATADGQGVLAHFVIELPPQQPLPELLWPLAANWGGDGGGADTVGVYDPWALLLRVRRAYTDGPPHVVLDYFDEEKSMVPFAGDFGAGESMGFYVPTLDGSLGGLVLYPHDFETGIVGGRRPINLPPPEDP